MNIRLFFLLISGLLFFSHGVTLAQASRGSASAKADSLRRVREHAADSIRDARTAMAESLKAQRERKTDSVAAVRKHRSDSLSAASKYKTSRRYRDSLTRVRKEKLELAKEQRQAKLDSMAEARYGKTDSAGGKPPKATVVAKNRNSRKYRDSVARARKDKTDLVKEIRQAKLDSMAEVRAHRADSLASARQTRTDSLTGIRKRRTDSLAAIKKYKGSKRYADSVTIAKHHRMDSIKQVQTAYRDSITTERKKSQDIVKANRKHSMDSLKAVRTRFSDSLKIVRKSKTDSLAKKKVEKDKLAKAKEKKKEDMTKLKLELKIKQKREAWSNKEMLKKKWTPVRAVTQNAFTHFNYYFNADKKMDEAQLNMQRARKENYDSLIGLFPFDPNKDSSLMASDMDTIIHKVSVGIQIHDPRVKWSTDMYLLLGQAYYYKGNYENAASAFTYIIAADEDEKKKSKSGYSKAKGNSSIVQENNKSVLNFMKHKSMHNDAILWLARTYTTAGQVENAEAILSLLASDKNLPGELKGRVAIEKAFAYLAEDNHPAASTQLGIAAADPNLPGWQRQRAAFLNGQLQQEAKNYKDAAHSFDAVLDYYPRIEMDFYARKYLAYNKLMAGENAEEAFAALKKLLNDAKYSTYYDQVYFVLGQLALKANKREEAITYFTKSTKAPKAAKKQKALSFAALGDAYYASARYPNAKAAYDSAAKYSTSGSKDAALVAAVQKSKVLMEVSGPVKIIHDQDSLLALAAMSKKEQQSAVRAYLRALEKARQDSILNAESGAPKEAEAEPMAEATSWYFSNPLQMQQGSADFKRKWGTRPLTDNWRRSAGNPLAGGGSGGTQGAAEEGEESKSSESKGMSEEALLAKIPNTPAQKDAAIKTEQRAYLALATAYYKQLDDYPRALHTLDTLDKRYPNHNLKEDELYLRYQIAIKQNQLDKAQAISKELLAQFPGSQYSNMLKPASESAAGPQGTKAVAEYFDETYKLLLQHQYTEVLMRTGYAQKQYNHPAYNKRFQIVEASANVAMGNYDKADTLIAAFIKANPGDTLVAWASTVQEYIKQVRNGGKPAWYKEGPPPTASTPKAETKEEGATAAAPAKPAGPRRPPNVPYSFTFQADSEHYAILILAAGLDSRTAGLKRNVKAFDSSKYASAKLEVLLDLYDITEGVLVIRKFPNAAAAKTYMSDITASAAWKGYGPEELKPLIISAPNYRKMHYDQETMPYLGFYGVFYK